LQQLQLISLVLLLSLFLEQIHGLAIQKDLLNQEITKSQEISDFLGISLIFSLFQRIVGFLAEIIGRFMRAGRELVGLKV